jgi:SAM-dependent methyltransferase
MDSGHHVPLTYHARLLGDVIRMEAFERAIRRLVRPGDVVLDLGCGTGILAMLAARRGARVHAVESTRVATLAVELAAKNGLAVTVHHADAVTLAPVEPVDLVIGDFLGCFLVDDGMLPAVEAAGRWLKPGGRFCPSRVELFLAPVGDFALPLVDVFDDSFYGLDLRAATPRALSVCQLGHLSTAQLLAPPQRYATYVPPTAPPFDAELRFSVERAGRVRALAGWFEATLADDVVLSTAPGLETHWGQHLFPLPPRDVAAGDELRAHVWLTPDAWHWHGTIAGVRFSVDEAPHA